MKAQTLAPLAGIALLLSLTACGGAGNTVSSTPAPPSAAAEVSTPPAAPAFAPFGGSVTFPSGVAISVSQPTVVAAGTYAIGAVEGKMVVFSVSVTNGSKAPVNGSMMSYPKVTYGTDGQKADFATDSAAGYGFNPFSTILPGETQTAKQAYGVPAAGYPALRVEVSGPSYSDLPAVFKGAVQ